MNTYINEFLMFHFEDICLQTMQVLGLSQSDFLCDRV